MSYRFLRNVVVKGLLLFFVFNLLWAACNGNRINQLSLYNRLLRGRERFPYGENPAQSYNLSLSDLDAMFASHVLAGAPKSSNEFRVIVIGDSSIWGTLLRPEETLPGILNARHLTAPDGRSMEFYNLGYPTMSLVKDLMVLDQAMQYAPDLILWAVTLESFPRENQLISPIVAQNPVRVNALIDRYDLELTPLEESAGFWQRTIVAQRRPLADWLRLQFYGVMWSATGVDQTYPTDYTPALRDLEPNANYQDWVPPEIPAGGLAMDVLSAGMKIAGEVPILLVNEPILVSDGENSDIRYNYYYPRWVYDQYRQNLEGTCEREGWTCLDLWDAVPQEFFTNSAIHRNPEGELRFATSLIESGVLP